MTSGKPSIFNVLDKSQHRIKRKHIGQAVSDKAMRAFEPTMAEQVDIFIGQLTACSEMEVPTNMTERFKCLGMDIVGLLAFGFPLNMQTDPKYRFVIRGLNVGGYQNHCFMQYPVLKKLGLHKLLVLLGKKERQKYLAMLQLMIESRLAEEPHAKNDLYSSVFDHLGNTADGIPTSQLWSEALFLFPAGMHSLYNCGQKVLRTNMHFSRRRHDSNGTECALLLPLAPLGCVQRISPRNPQHVWQRS